ncbi:VOC family protein [Streptomyces sp. NPDC048172]|uniref:VOC family protein n=1 Tax=Streptomyces sp. NPDC048172 TaxID=3365505 RepID=UPI00370FA38C
MSVSLFQIAVDAHDPGLLGRFWAEVLDWKVVYEDEEEVVIGKSATALPGITFLAVPEEKAGKNRLHIDLTPGDGEGEQQAEIERIVALGARRADVGQGPEVTWTVLADPEGNEFCVLRHKTEL